MKKFLFLFLIIPSIIFCTYHTHPKYKHIKAEVTKRVTTLDIFEDEKCASMNGVVPQKICEIDNGEAVKNIVWHPSELYLLVISENYVRVWTINYQQNSHLILSYRRNKSNSYIGWLLNNNNKTDIFLILENQVYELGKITTKYIN